MSVKEMAQELSLQLEKHGYRGKIVSIERLQELQKDIEEHYRTGLFCEEIYQKYLARLDFKVPTSLPAAKSCIIVAIPQPQVKVSFILNGISAPLFIPPTYAYSVDEHIKALLGSLLEPNGYRLVKMALPLKLLAVRSGLAQYGKNNITYVTGMGSFHRLVAFCTDFFALKITGKNSRSWTIVIPVLLVLNTARLELLLLIVFCSMRNSALRFIMNAQENFQPGSMRPGTIV